MLSTTKMLAIWSALVSWNYNKLKKIGGSYVKEIYLNYVSRIISKLTVIEEILNTIVPESRFHHPTVIR